MQVSDFCTLNLVPVCRKVLCFDGEGSGDPLQYSCLENPTDGGAWWAAVYGTSLHTGQNGFPSRSPQTVNAGERVEKMEHFCTIGGNLN